MSRVPGGYPSWARTLLIASSLALFAVQTPAPWGMLWIVVPLSTALSLLAGWRFGARGVLVPVALLAVAMALGGMTALWVWWPAVAALAGLWMGIREEGGGPTSGERAWMLLPVLAFAAWMPWSPTYPGFASRVEKELVRADQQLVELARQTGSSGERVATVERAVTENARLRQQALPSLLPSALFVWIVLLIAAGRMFASRAAGMLKWPPLSRTELKVWRLPDTAVWLFLAGLAILVTPWSAGASTAWTLLLNSGLGYSIQGIAVVEALLLARGFPPTLIVATLAIVFALAMPVFLLTSVAVGLSDVWLDYRRLDAPADPESSS
jgi:hypothetical protein